MDRNLELKKQISSNIKAIMKKRGMKQLDLAEKSGIAKSTISDYINNKTLINTANVQKLADSLNVKKSDIDPTFKINNSDNKNIDTIAAHLDGDLSDEDLEQVVNLIEFLKKKNKGE